MKLHSVLTDELIHESEKLTRRLIDLTRMGVHPEGGVIPDRFEIPDSFIRREEPLDLVEEVPVTDHSGFILGRKSLRELVGVHADLIECVTRAIDYTTVDFRVYDGLRTSDEQLRYKASGVSRTLQSKHLPQADGFGHAVDLVPIINGVLKWDWDGCYKIACAMDKAATELDIAHRIRWGGAWDRTLKDYGGEWTEYRAEVEAYKRRHPGPDFIDGPHFELV